MPVPLKERRRTTYKTSHLTTRLITDIVIIAYETLNSMGAKQKGIAGSMATKLDISKEYDRIEWIYLESMLRKMGFPELWISRVMFCVFLMEYSVFFNGVPGSSFKPGKSIRQRDPISPLLYILCAEGLSSLINLVESSKQISGFSVTRGNKPITHLFFAENRMLFCKALLTEWLAVQRVLNIYENASKQCLNRHKYFIFFTANTTTVTKTQLTNLSGVPSCCNQDLYLGLPTYVGKAKNRTFKIIKDKVWARLDNWKNTHLSLVGKEVLLKSIVQAIFPLTP